MGACAVGGLYYAKPVSVQPSCERCCERFSLALGLHIVGLGLTTDSRGMDYIDDLIDEFDPVFCLSPDVLL